MICILGDIMTGKLATEKWYREISAFDFNDKKFSPETGHFSQVVWKESIEIGAAVATSENGMHFYVARYIIILNFKFNHLQELRNFQTLLQRNLCDCFLVYFWLFLIFSLLLFLYKDYTKYC